MDYGRIISIPAPVRGATIRTAMYQQIIDISIPAPVWGATYVAKYSNTGASVFQFPPPCGGRQQIYTKINCCKYAK